MRDFGVLVARLADLTQSPLWPEVYAVVEACLNGYRAEIRVTVLPLNKEAPCREADSQSTSTSS